MHLICLSTNVDEFDRYFNFAEEIFLPSCGVESDDLTTGETLIVPQMTSC